MLQPPISLACQPGAARTLLLALAAMRGSRLDGRKRLYIKRPDRLIYMGVYQPVVCEMRGQLRARECPSVELVSLAWVYISLSQCESSGIIYL